MRLFEVTNIAHQIAEEHKLSDDQVKQALLINKFCQPFLKQLNYKPMTEYPLYRGLNVTPLTMFVYKDIRLESRNPLDTPIDTHHVINDYFIKHFGEPFRDAMFATGDNSEADNYGVPFYTFPVGNFKFLWARDVPDLWGFVEEFQHTHEEEDHRRVTGHENEDSYYDDWFADELANLLDTKKWETTDLSTAIKFDHEIMIRGASYYGISARPGYNNLNSKKIVGMEKIFKL